MAEISWLKRGCRLPSLEGHRGLPPAEQNKTIQLQKGWWAGQLKYSHRCLSSVLFKRRRPSPWNSCTTGAPSSSGRRRLRPIHQDRALSSTFLSDKSIRFKQLYIQIFEFRPLEFLKKLSPSPSYRFPCSQFAAPSENSLS